MRSLLQATRRLALVLLVVVVGGQAALAVSATPSLPISTDGVKKFALVIGNGNYAGEKRSLKNSVNDAKLMAQSLLKLGFDVKQYADLDRAHLVSAVADFSAALPQGATALVFYAGHGMQISGASYLIPVDMAVTSEQSVPLRAYPVKTLLEQVSASKSAVNVVVLDACRDNPFQPSSPVKYRSLGNLGLAPVQAPRGTVVAYSTAPGQLAADGKEGNSVYTATLASVIQEPGLSLEGIFKKAGDQVRKKTLDDQIPWFESSLTEEYFFQPPAGVAVVAGRPLKSDTAVRAHTKVATRGTTISAVPNADMAWYRNMSDYEWSQLDWEVQQRVKNLTQDELPMLEHRANGGSVVAQTTLGLAWREGISRATESTSSRVMRYQANNTKALQWLRKAAQAGFPIAQTELGEMLYAGKGTDRNLPAARQQLEQAALANYPRARLDLLQLQMESGTATGKDVQSVIDSMIRGVRKEQVK